MATVQQGNGVEPTAAPNCNLHHEAIFSASAASGVSYTLIGESANPAATVDQVIVVDCTVAELNSVLTYEGNWAGDANGVDAVDGVQPYPTCSTDFALLAQAAGARSNLEDTFNAKDTSGAATVTFEDNSGDNTLWTLQSYFMNPASYPFLSSLTSAGGVAENLLNDIPAESVKSIVTDSLTVTPMADIVAPAVNDAANALELFKQADAAGKIPGGGATAFTAGDSITLYVDYALSKEKTFKLDAASGALAKFTINGQAVPVANNDKLTSTASIRIGWQFRAKAGLV
jgi:hypothetical protein